MTEYATETTRAAWLAAVLALPNSKRKARLLHQYRQTLAK